MKKLILLLLAFTLVFISCKKDEKKDAETVIDAPKKFYVDGSTSTVQWTAYKTTAKTPVTGKFLQLKIQNPTGSTTKLGALQGLSFEIPISSFFSDNDERDNKIKQLFWGIMKDTSVLNGTFKRVHGDENKGKAYVSIIMNQVAQELEMDYTMEGNKVTLKGTMMLMNWNIKEAFDSLHKACEVLHTGEDGISKTWDEVAVEAVAIIKEE